MKRTILIASTLALLVTGCKVSESSKKSQSAQEKSNNNKPTKVFSVPAPKDYTRDKPVSDTMYEPADKAANGTVAGVATKPKATTTPATTTVAETGKPVSIRSEKFTLETDDQASYGNKAFFIIVGSFSSNENAGKFKSDLTQQGFKPIILHSETGNFRVCIDTFNDEVSARNRVQKIRAEHPKLADCWLLIKK